MKEPRLHTYVEATRGVLLKSSIHIVGDQSNCLSPDQVLASFPSPRLAPYLREADEDAASALELYSWNAQMAGAALEQLAHLEVLLRHAIDKQFAQLVNEEENGIPWFLLPPFISAQEYEIDKVRVRLRALRRETRDQIVAGLTFGFWSGWLGAKYEELWRQALHHAFPHGSGLRKDVSVLVEQIRKFRNRVAHHDSLLHVDVGFEMEAVFKLAQFISPDAANWMKSVDRTKQIGSLKPISNTDTVVVPAARAWTFYEESFAYICQAGRYFQDVKHIAFYANQEVQQDVPRIKSRHDNVAWNQAEAKRLKTSKNRTDRKLGAAMEAGLQNGFKHGTYQVFLLSSPNDPAHVRLEEPLRNPREGRSSAYVRKQRYTSIHQLRHASTVWEL